ncbi:MAG: bacterial transcriptional activator domain-containing protein [Anaerolinea sp.]|nr:bacterial transcriptional activator domain-containing protein [Anaerolinea sp.]
MVAEAESKLILDALDQIRDKTKGKRVILIYPFAFPSSGNTFLSAFLSHTESGLLYYRITSEQTTIPQFLNGLVAEFQNRIGTSFGRNLRHVLSANARSADLGQALAEDLNEYSKSTGRSVILYIDELDRLPMARDFEAFANALVEELDRRVQIAFNSRMLRQQPWYSLVRSGKAVVLGAELRKDDMFFTVEDEPKPQLEVYAFGRGHALVNGRPISSWDGALPRNLFFFFIDRPLVTRAEIFETFWPDLSIKEATNVFHVTKRKIAERISAQIDDGNNYELTQYLSGYYLPSDKVIRHYDVADFVDSISRAQASENSHEQAILYMRAIDLYRAPFLQTIDMPWIQERREALRGMYVQALTAMAGIWQERDRPHEALGFYIRALHETPDREDLHQEVIRLYNELGMKEDAMRHYQHMEALLKERNAKPSKALRDMMKTITSGV